MSTFHVVQEGPVNALALNRDYSQVAIGGRNVFKVYAIEEDRFREVCNLRNSKHLNLSFSCNDVSWSSTDDHYLATAATNGHVCVWNLTKMGKAMQEQDYQEHKRTVNKVTFHASEPNRLLSGSQDGTMRYFDIRMKSAVAIFYSNTESVRDVRFSPHNPYTFAAVSENGSVQLWDVRRADKCQQQFTAHSGPVFACDWHNKNVWLATASRDKTIKVWDMSTIKPSLEYTIHTIASIGHIKWHPLRDFEIASCALVVDSSINIWDVRRPYIPYAAFNEHKDIVSGVAWKRCSSTFLSTGRDCTLYQHSFDDASLPASKANPQSLSLNNNSEVLFARKKKVNPIFRLASDMEVFHVSSSLLQHFVETSAPDQSFIGLAKSYVLSGRSLSELCEHNSAVARAYGKFQVATVWKIIKTVYGEEFLQNSASAKTHNRDDGTSHGNVPISNIVTSVMGLDENDQRSRGGDTPAAQFSDETENEDQVDHIAIYSNGFPTYLNIRTGLPKGDFSFGENELDMEFDGSVMDFRSSLRPFPNITPQPSEWTLPNEAFHVRHEIRDRSPPSEEFPNNNSPDITDEPPAMSMEEQTNNLLTVSSLPNVPLWEPSGVVLEALKYYATLGDVQTAACVLIVLGERRKCLVDLDENTQEHWLLGYIELLSRFQLWNVVSQIIKLSWIPSVAQLNQQSTRFTTNCSKCSKPLQRIGWLCDRCHSSEYTLCTVCHQVVKGLYAWCQGCSHGGHLTHVREWIKNNKTCPTGCGHLCEYR